MKHLKLGATVRPLSKYHKKNIFEVVFIEGNEITCLYHHEDERKEYRLITKRSRLVKI